MPALTVEQPFLPCNPAAILPSRDHTLCCNHTIKGGSVGTLAFLVDVFFLHTQTF